MTLIQMVDRVWAEEPGVEVSAVYLPNGTVILTIIQDGAPVAHATLGAWRWGRLHKIEGGAMSDKISFEDWYKELRRIADATSNGWVISSNPAEHYPAYEEGSTPEEEFLSQCEDAVR